MRFDLVTIFPQMVRGPVAAGVLGRACEASVVDVRVHDLRDFADPPRRSVDDEPYGGGAGMVFRIEPWWRAAEALPVPGARVAVVVPSPAGELFTQATARELGDYEQVVFLCDRYEGSDGRLAELASHEIGIGDFVVTGGELVALLLMDAVARTRAGVVGDAASVAHDSFAHGLLDHRAYTRPPLYRGLEVPEVLRSGDHRRIAEWRRRDALGRTLERRPELLDGVPLGDAERRAMESLRGGGATPKRESEHAQGLVPSRPGGDGRRTETEMGQCRT